MIPLFEIIRVISPIIIVIAVGYLFGRFKKADVKTLADYIIYISSPALVITLLSKQEIILNEISSLAFSVILVVAGAGAAAYLLSKITKIHLPAGMYLPIMFMNSGFIGYPLALFAFGDPGLGKAIIYDVINGILLFTLGIYIASRGKDSWQVLKLPFIYAAAAGIFISLSGAKLPQFIDAPLSIIGGTNIPIALFMLGSRLANIKITSWKLPLLASCLRLGLGFGFGLLAVLIFKVQGIAAQIVILSSSLPCAITTAAIAEEYDRESALVASTIFLSTLLSIISMLVILSWIGLS